MKNKSISITNIILVWILGLAGQICWNLENQWFNTYVYANIGYFPGIITGMLISSALFTAFSTFLFGTLSDRIGKRKPFVCFGYIIWGIFTILFGLTHLLKGIIGQIWILGSIVVLADSIMSFFGSMGNDSGFSAWTTDIMNKDNQGFIGTSIATQPVIGTIAGTLLGGMIIDSILGYIGLFSIFGGLVIVIGIISLFIMKDEKITKNVNGSFWHQFASNFNFKDFFKIKELVLVFITLAIFFIGFNCFFNHIGNLFIYYYGFEASSFSLIEGVALIIGVIVAIFMSPLLKKNIAPLLVLISIVLEIIGLIWLTIISNLGLYDVSHSFVAKNILMIIGMIFVGIGYILFMQVIMVWAKNLYPSDKRGQFEGIKIIFFVLIPMIFGSLISYILIRVFGKVGTYESYGELVEGKIPTYSLFIAAAIIMFIALIPLYFLNKKYKERINEKKVVEDE